MNKFMKSFVTAMLAVCMVVCLGLAAACTQDEKADPNSIEVTVQLPDGTAAKGVNVQICADNGDEVGCLMPVPVGEDGKVVIDVKKKIEKNTTLFAVHLLGVPEGYAYVDENGDEYDSEHGVVVDITKGNTVTIKLAEKKTQSLNIDIALADVSATQKVTPAITKDGLYELRSISAFTVSGDGFSLTEGYNNVLVSLKVGDSLSFGTKENLSFSVSVVAATADGVSAPISTLTANAAVLKLGANESVNISNPSTGAGGVTNSPVIVNGSNYSATLNGKTLTEEFAVAAGKTFSVKAVDSTKYVVLNFAGPVSRTTVNVGESKDFEVSLINTADGDKETLQWISSTYYVVFTPSEAGFYKINVSSDFDGDALYISQIGSDIHYPAASDKSAESGKAYYSVFKLRANETYMAFVSSSSNFAGKAEGDSVVYTATVEKVAPVYKEITLNSSNKAELDKDFAYSYTVPAFGNYAVTVSDASVAWYLNGDEYTQASGTVAVNEGDVITLDTRVDCTVTIEKTYDNSINVVMSEDGEPFVYTANIENAGWYCISNSVVSFKIAVDGLLAYAVPEANDIVVYLTPDAQINITLTGGATTATLSLNKATFAGTQADPLQIEDGRAVILNHAQDTYYFKNPEYTSNRQPGKKLDINGNGFKATYNEEEQWLPFTVNVGETFTVVANENTVAVVTASAAPVTGTLETPDYIDDISQTYNFTIDLEEDFMGYMSWPEALEGVYYIEFCVETAGSYNVSLTWNAGEEFKVSVLSPFDWDTMYYGDALTPVTDTENTGATSYSATFTLDSYVTYAIKFEQYVPLDTTEKGLSYSVSITSDGEPADNPNIINVVMNGARPYTYTVGVANAGWYEMFVGANDETTTFVIMKEGGFELNYSDVRSVIIYLTPGETYKIASETSTSFTLYLKALSAGVDGNGSIDTPFIIAPQTYYILNGSASKYYFMNRQSVEGSALNIIGKNANVATETNRGGFDLTGEATDPEVTVGVGETFLVTPAADSVAIICGVAGGSGDIADTDIVPGVEASFEITLVASGNEITWPQGYLFDGYSLTFATGEAGSYRITVTGVAANEIDCFGIGDGSTADNVEITGGANNTYTCTFNFKANTVYTINVYLPMSGFDYTSLGKVEGDKITYKILIEKVA